MSSKVRSFPVSAQLDRFIPWFCFPVIFLRSSSSLSKFCILLPYLAIAAVRDLQAPPLFSKIWRDPNFYSFSSVDRELRVFLSQILLGVPRAHPQVGRRSSQAHKFNGSKRSSLGVFLDHFTRGILLSFPRKTALPISQRCQAKPRCANTFLVSFISLASAFIGYFPPKKQAKPHKSPLFFFFFCQNLHVGVRWR